ncbi:MAG: hypothetical protein DWQ01_07690 [Planctomycetota bacterium]|nr:MAG: hypothetical protein DWQ01_07690 [Planctomycetota bacterium]
MDRHLEELVNHVPAWLQSGGQDRDVAVASRVRLARNLERRRFPHRLETKEAREICVVARGKLEDYFDGGTVVEPASLGPAERDLLVERSLASRDLLDAPRPTLALFDRAESLGLMVNEEDHFRLQSLTRGFDLTGAWNQILPLGRALGEHFELARHRKYGYLTACPSNVGTGLRASLMLHLPALARVRKPLSQVLKTAQRSYLAVRGVHGEGSQALGHLYQISNQRTLGTDVSEQIQAVAEFGRQTMNFEREVRGAMLRDAGHKEQLIVDVQESHQLLKTAKKLTTAQALDALSMLRLAVLADLKEALDGSTFPPHKLLHLCFRLRPGHLQARLGSELGPEARDYSRAKEIRDALRIPFEEEA